MIRVTGATPSLSLSLTLNLSLSFGSLSNTLSKRSSDDPRKPTVVGSRRTKESNSRNRREEEKKSRGKTNSQEAEKNELQEKEKTAAQETRGEIPGGQAQSDLVFLDPVIMGTYSPVEVQFIMSLLVHLNDFRCFHKGIDLAAFQSLTSHISMLYSHFDYILLLDQPPNKTHCPTLHFQLQNLGCSLFLFVGFELKFLNSFSFLHHCKLPDIVYS
ncbi:hypothetical protein M9H77_24308 [Catharanthus roseus]|uniref:Uncharacterized protein n=1 Tax=Catharanthus roseus TaxID=4058 RepID=A0ACC0AXI4_CATRO|nr:hypothetical protein M9H77_24308 [Catharanthus roseus]